MRKQVFTALLAITLALPTAFISHAADPVYPEGVPAPGRNCGQAIGTSVTDSMTKKTLICTKTGDFNSWQVQGEPIYLPVNMNVVTPLPNEGQDEGYEAPNPPGTKNYQGLYHNDLAGLTRFTSALVNFQPSDQNPTSVTLCKSLSDSACANPGVIKYWATLPVCDAINSSNCLSSVTATKPDGTKVQGIIKGIFNLDNPQNYQGDVTQGLPTGSEPTLVQFPGITHSGGDLFLVKPYMVGQKGKLASDWYLRQFRLSIFAVKMVDGNFGFTKFSTIPDNYKNNIGEAGDGTIGGPRPAGCAATSTKQCAAMYPLPLDISFNVSLKFSKAITGWLHGRVTQPTITLQTEPNGGALLSIDAKPIKTPTNAAWISNDVMPQSLKDWYGNDHTGSAIGSGPNRDLFAPFSEIALLRDGNNNHNERTLSEYVQWLPLLSDRAQAMPTIWSIQTMSDETPADSPVMSCIKKQKNLAGLVTTNAAEYIDGPPVYKDGTLDYKVAATHFEKDGKTAFQGTYDLLMSSEVARCIYGFTNAPIKASISVTNNEGGASIASTVIKEGNGWLTLGAYGFTFSSPTIKVKLTQASTPAKVVTPVAKKITITCVKGKTTKKVTAVKPVCPAGYKKI